MERIPATKNKARVPSTRVRRDETLPFPETPASNHYDDKGGENSMHAAELFSRFTADIIKKDVVFTR